MGIQVPKLGDQRIQQRAIPVTPTSGQAPVGAFGEGVEQVTNEGRKIAAGINKVGDEQLKKANQLWFMNAENQLAAKQTEIESNAKQQKGRSAFNLHEESKKEFDDFADTLETNNDSQKLGLQSIRSQRSTSLNRTITGHVDNQYEIVQKQETDAAKINYMNSAASNSDDPTRIGEDFFKYNSVVADEADQLGLGGEARKAFILQNQSEFHATMIEQMLADSTAEKNPVLSQNARTYFDDNADQMTELEKKSLQPAIHEAGVRADAELIVDGFMTDMLISLDGNTIVDATTRDWKERNQEADKIKDPELKKEVKRQLAVKQEEQMNVRKEADNASYMDALNTVENNQGQHPRDTVDPSAWAKMTKSQQDSLIRMSSVRIVPTDMNKYREFYTLPDQATANMTHAQLTERYLSHFDESLRKTATDIWLRKSNNVERGSSTSLQLEPEEYANQFLRDNEMFDTISKKDLSAGELAKYELFIENFNRGALAHEKEFGAKPDELQSKEIASKQWYQTIRMSDGDDATRTTVGEAILDDGGVTGFGATTAKEIRGAGIPFQRTKDGKIKAGMVQSEVLEIENTLRSVFQVPKPEGFSARAAQGKSGIDFGIRATTEGDSLYANLIQNYKRAVKNRDTFRAKQLVKQYKKDLQELK